MALKCSNPLKISNQKTVPTTFWHQIQSLIPSGRIIQGTDRTCDHPSSKSSGCTCLNDEGSVLSHSQSWCSPQTLSLWLSLRSLFHGEEHTLFSLIPVTITAAGRGLLPQKLHKSYHYSLSSSASHTKKEQYL